MARDLDEHTRHLADAVAGRYDGEQIRRRVEAFVRPAGWHQPATPLLADAIVRLGGSRVSPVRRWLASGTRLARRQASEPQG
jgi:hypothetical protein